MIFSKYNFLTSILISVFVSIFISLSFPSYTSAQIIEQGQGAGGIIDGGQGVQGNPFGSVKNPLPNYQSTCGSGLIALLNNILRLIFVAAGIFAFIKFVLAGLKFISSSGDAKGIEAAWSAIWQSLIGLVIIISSFAVAALAGQLLFGDATAILNPKVYGPIGCQ